jgi:hypothetical protein
VTPLRYAESESPPTQEDAGRLWRLATWIEQRPTAMGGAFTGMAQ